MFDWLDPKEWIKNVVLGLAELFSQSHATFIKQIIELLFAVALPTPEKLASNWFKLGLGATYGLAAQLMTLVTIVIAFIVIVTPFKSHGHKLSRGLSSFVTIVLFSPLFYPVYGMLYSLSQGATQGILNIATSSPDGNADSLVNLIKLVLPEDPLSRMFTVGIAAFFGFLTLLEGLALQVALIFLLVFYPLVLALRPIGGFWRALFNLSNAGITTVIASPPIMGLGFALPVLVRDSIPGGQLPFVAPILTIIGGIFAALAPFLLAAASYRGSKEVFGSVDAAIAGKLDVNSMPPVTVEDAKKDVEDTQKSTLKTITEVIQVADLADDDLLGNMKETALKVGVAVATTTGHPEVATVLNAADSFIKSRPKPQNPDHN
jgi:hypothetical protein